MTYCFIMVSYSTPASYKMFNILIISQIYKGQQSWSQMVGTCWLKAKTKPITQVEGGGSCLAEELIFMEGGKDTNS